MVAVLNPQALSFRPMTSADLDEIMRIERRAYAHPWTVGIFRDCLRVGYSCWVAEMHDMIEAYSVMSVAVQECHILNLCVRSGSQNQGYGGQMLRHMLEIGKRRGAVSATLEVRPSNKQALRLYRRFGFREVGLRKNYYPDERGREDALILNRDFD
ncbi:MAG: ribosomal protein S18-alanine N-acetyltransferase [Chromatiales bacterium]|nr:ribosomal protein S18-alanine N-acetyltransferase [Chromatiales bacterium]